MSVSDPEDLLDRIERLVDVRAEQDFDRALELLDALPRRWRNAPRALALRGYALYCRKCPDEATERRSENEGRRYLVRAIETAGDDRLTACRTAMWLSEWHHHREEGAAALEYGRRARTHLTASATPRLVGGVAIAIARALLLAGGRPGEATRQLRRAVRYFRRAGDHAREFMAWTLLAEHLVRRGRPRGIVREVATVAGAWRRRFSRSPGRPPWTEAVELSEALAAIGDGPRALDLLEACASRPGIQRRKIAEAAFVAGFMLRDRHPEAAVPLLRRATGLGLDPELAARAGIAISKALVDVNRWDESATESRRLLHNRHAPIDVRRAAALNLAVALAQSSRIEDTAETLDALRSAAADGDPELVAQTRAFEAMVATRAGSHERARELYESAIETGGDVLQPDQRIHLLLRLAENCDVLGDRSASAKALADAGRLVRDVPAFAQASYHQHRAALARGRGQSLRTAAADLRRAEALFKSSGDTISSTACRLDRASLALDRGRTAECRKLLAATRRDTSDVPFLKAAWHEARARLEVHCDNVSAAVAHMKKAAAAYRLGGLPMAEASSWSDAAHVLDLGSRPAAAIAPGRTALDLTLAMLAVVESEPDRLDVLARCRGFGAHLVDLLERERGAEAALPVVFEVKGGEFLRLLRSAALRHHTRAAVPLLQPWQMAAPRTADGGGSLHLGTLEAIRSHPEGDPDAGRRAMDRYRELTRHRGATAPTELDVRDVLARLGPDELGIEYFLGEDDGQMLAFCLRRSGVRCLRLPWSARLARVVAEVAELVQWDGAAGPATAARLLESGLRRLHEALVSPLREDLTGIRRLSISRGGTLALVPLAALIDREGRFLLDRFDIRHVVSHAQLAWSSPRGPRYRRALVLRGADDAGRTILPHADRECADVAECLTRSGCNPIGDRAGLRALRAADIVHYAGHAVFDEQQGMAAALCLPDRRLQAVDLLALRLPHAPLVVLSGCETGRVATRGDEFVGFVRSLFAAGASSVVASSWVAHDEGTTTLMRWFYEELLSNRLSPSAALSAASRRLRLSGGRWAHPFYWANFRCYGAS